MTDDQKKQDVGAGLSRPDQETPADMESCLKQRDEYLAGWKRALADYANREKELAREKQMMAGYATEDAIQSFIPVLDNMKSALAHVPAEHAGSEWAKGVGFIVKQFEGVLNGYGVRAFETVGKPFDPTRHEAAGEEEAGDLPAGRQALPPGTVAREVQSGYELDGRVIRPAKVILKK
ncbi:MAG: nucleotide exchange factor GrpE [Patescibacteria group bacterium]